MVTIVVTTMDRSIRRLPDPVAVAPHGERRRCVRQRLHTPVYASFNGLQTGMVVDLSELLDLHEDGFAVQTSERLEMNRAVTLCLELTETKSYIHGSGQVVWSDEAGRGGIRFSALPESSRQILKEWLFANLLIGCSNHAVRTEQRARRDSEQQELHEPAQPQEASAVVPSVAPSAVPSTVPRVVPISARSEPLSLLEAVRREVRESGDDIDAVLQLITERALSLTGASGAALAFVTDNRMMCRARAGEPAPPLGAPVDVKQGLSGECVRSGLLVSCEDMQNDPRVDPEIGRALGIGSLMAAPIVSDFRVVGLLEVFSPYPSGFTKVHASILDRLAEMIPRTPHEKLRTERTQAETLVRPAELASLYASKLASPAETGIPSSNTVESGVVNAAAIKVGSTHAPREAFREQEPDVDVTEQEFQQPSEQIVARPAAAQAHRTAPSLFERWLHRGLLGLAIAVVFVVLGYLAGPMIEKRWAASPQASENPGASPVSGQSANRGRTGDVASAKSLTDLRKLADQGDADAQWQMGVRYHGGEDVRRDDAQAMQWFLRAAEQGNVAAQSSLGSYYWAGRGVLPDLSKAYFWSAIATAQGDEISKGRLEGLASQMTREQVSAARQQAELWIHTHSERAK
jgi:GAF domain/Sel1 repeat/PilZ domain